MNPLTAVQIEAYALWKERLEPIFIAAKGDKPAAVKLAVYETAFDYAALRPEDQGQWTFEFHNAVMQEVSMIIRKMADTPCVIVTLRSADYLRWLAKRRMKNSPEARAEFIHE